MVQFFNFVGKFGKEKIFFENLVVVTKLTKKMTKYLAIKYYFLRGDIFILLSGASKEERGRGRGRCHPHFSLDMSF
jgi:hypothetical protein